MAAMLNLINDFIKRRYKISMNQSIIMPYHRNKDMLKYTTAQLEKYIDSDVEIIVVGNNADKRELDVELSSTWVSTWLRET